MEKIEIYKFQLKAIETALRLTKRIYITGKDSRESCYDRDVKQALLYAENALNGDIDKKVKRFGNK